MTRLWRILTLWWAYGATAALLALAGGSLWFYVLDTPHPIVFNNVPFPVDRREYSPGESVIATVDLCRYSAASSVTVIELAGTNKVGLVKIYLLPDRAAPPNPNLGCVIAQVPTVIPLGVSPGFYNFRAVRSFHVNRFSTRSVPWETQPFEVRAP